MAILILHREKLIYKLKQKNMNNFAHLHVHTHYSIDGLSEIRALIDKAIADGMTAMAITDHGNMFGIKHFIDYAARVSERTGKGFKPVIGCEVYLASASRFDRKRKKDRNDSHLILLAKNKTGYCNLVKLVSFGYTEGFYFKSQKITVQR